MLTRRSCSLKTRSSPYRNSRGILERQTNDGLEWRDFWTLRARVRQAAFAITVISPFTDSPDCLIIPRSAITPISISSRFAGALYNHSGTAVRESNVSENWTRETFSKLVTFHADTSPVSYFALTRLPRLLSFTLPIPFPSLLPLSLRLLRLLPCFLFQSSLQRHELLKPDFRIYIGLAAPAVLYRAADFSTIMSLTAQYARRHAD